MNTYQFPLKLGGSTHLHEGEASLLSRALISIKRLLFFCFHTLLHWFLSWTRPPKTCIGYLDHPFKNKHVEVEKELLPLLANTGGSVYNQTSSAADLCSNNNTLMWMEKIFMAGILTPLLRLLEGCLHALSTCFARWTKPLTSSLPLQTLADLRRSKSELVAENALLREQLIILKRQVKRPACTNTDRVLLLLLARLVHTWQNAILIVQPDTLLRWHRELFRMVWRYKSKTISHTPKIAEKTIALIRQMATENRLWGAERIRGELMKLGLRVCKRTIQKYMRTVRKPQPRGQRWTTFLHNHATQVWACDFLQVTDLFFRPLFAFFLIELQSRKVIHVGVTRSPNDAWVAQQLREATPYGQAPKYLIRDNDTKFGSSFARVATTSAIEIFKTPYHAPQANAICERFLRSVRQECLDHLLILQEKQLQRVLNEYVAYFNRARPHQGIAQQIPEQLSSVPSSQDVGNKVIALPVVGGLHHDYQWAA
jgi:transposase InsO family protein